MKFIIKGTKPIVYDTLDWVAMEDSNTGKCFLNITGKLFRLDNESFEMLHTFYENKLLDPLWTIVLENDHIFIWN
jgi:hypothetical protein